MGLNSPLEYQEEGRKNQALKGDLHSKYFNQSTVNSVVVQQEYSGPISTEGVVLIDVYNNFAVLDYETQKEHGLFYIGDLQKTEPIFDLNFATSNKAMIDVV